MSLLQYMVTVVGHLTTSLFLTWRSCQELHWRRQSGTPGTWTGCTGRRKPPGAEVTVGRGAGTGAEAGVGVGADTEEYQDKE